MIRVTIVTPSGRVVPVSYTKESQLQINAEKFPNTIFFYLPADLERSEKKEVFAKYLTVDCDECDAKVGDLCVSEGVWVHLSRFKKADSREIHAP